MKSLLKSNTLVFSLTLCLSTILGLWAIERNTCFAVISEQITVKIGFCDEKNN